MKVFEDYTVYETQTIRIINASYLEDYVIKIEFEDGTKRLVDFKPFLTKAGHPSIKKYQDETTFKTFGIVDGNLNWNDYDMIFPVWELYRGVIHI